MRPIALSALLSPAILLLPGCSASTSGARPPADPDPAVLRSDVRTPFAPARMRVHPLTALSRDDQGERIIILYVELLDEWDDGVKGVGILRAEVTDGDQTRQWNVDLFDMAINGPAYDPHTRTYRFVLGQLPAWVASGTRVGVLLETLDSEGEPINLFDEVPLP